MEDVGQQQQQQQEDNAYSPNAKYTDSCQSESGSSISAGSILDKNAKGNNAANAKKKQGKKAKPMGQDAGQAQHAKQREEVKGLVDPTKMQLRKSERFGYSKYRNFKQQTHCDVEKQNSLTADKNRPQHARSLVCNDVKNTLGANAASQAVGSQMPAGNIVCDSACQGQ